ncbi:hypothetical protein OKA05_28720 [Luteolibacter arcticus]|uniref:Uncharacterized protein n=1 Tax=Luteolibacter arcticus TaxID=1581411 RepID=A0ABT3GSX8_9BACT|nr:hypothetical protein [Luteolibacter arcticus]MCW1926570.1 hypothetical protein [Luteolibacter arcticus]
MEATIRQDALATDLAKVRQARAMSPEMKFRAGYELFEEACRWSLAGIASQFPDMDESSRLAELRRRLALAGS